MVDIRIYTVIIIEKDGKFLVGKEMMSDDLRWSDSPYEAWKTRRKDKAYIVSYKVKGTRYLFNPVARQLREMRFKYS